MVDGQYDLVTGHDALRQRREIERLIESGLEIRIEISRGMRKR
jgi:hypothetical protein